MRRNYSNAQKPISKFRNHLLMWKVLRSDHNLREMNFEEYKSVGEYTVEFCSTEKSIIIETEEFEDPMNESASDRDDKLKKNGYRILRYQTFLVREFPEIIVQDIKLLCSNSQ